MKVTKNQLKQLISEEIKNVLSEGYSGWGLKGDPDNDYGYGDYFSRGSKPQQKTPSPAVSTDKAVDDQDEAKKAADEIRDLATELEKMLTDDKLKEKATAIIGLVNTRL